MAFSNATDRVYHFLNTTPPTINGIAFYGNVRPIFYVPAESVETYQTALGSTWGKYVQAEPSN
jgi:hypothetical protein